MAQHPLLLPHSGGRQVACGLEPEEFLLRPRTAGQHTDQFGARPGHDIWVLGPLPQGAKVPLNLFHIHLYFTASGNGARPFPSSVIRPPSSVGGLESEKWATDSASAISLQGLPFTSYFCHHYMVSGRAAPYIHITSSKRPHLWLRARHESSARKRNAAVRSELIKTQNEFLSDSAFGAENCFLSFSRIDNDLINRGQLR